MELYNALKTVIELQGRDILKDPRLINILSDFKAYEDIPASKYLLKNMINEGLMAKLLLEYQSSPDAETLLASHRLSLSDTYGFKEDIADYVLNSLAYAQGWISEEPSFNIHHTPDGLYEGQINPIDTPEDDGQHLLFKQFPINGDVNSFIRQLTASGYTLVEPFNSEYNIASLKGTFAGNTDSIIAVFVTPKSKIVYSVMVFFQEHHIWYTLKDEYEKVKAQLTRKYGTPESYEYFLDPYYEGDGSELTALYSSHCKYLSVFKTNVGQIIVNMTSDAKVTIAYQDTINNSIKDAENESIADDDL